MASGLRRWTDVALEVRRSSTRKGRAQTGVMVVEGKRLLERALRAGCAPRHVLVGESVIEESPLEGEGLVAQLRAVQCAVHVVPDADLLELSDGRNSGLLVGLCELPQTRLGLGDLAALNGPILCLVQVEEPGNVGAMVRTALASGARAVLAVGGCDPFHPKAVRTSLGSLFTLPVLRVSGVPEALDATRGMTRLAAVAQAGRAPWEVEVTPNPALFMGNEGSGLPDSVVRLLDAPVTIPMPPGVDSFSVNAAAAVLLYELQRRKATGQG